MFERRSAGLLGILMLVLMFASSASAMRSGSSTRAGGGFMPRTAGGGHTLTVAGVPAISSSNLIYHGGPVMRTNTTYAIYWRPPGTTYDANYESDINRYFSDVAAASGSLSNVYGVDTQYFDNTGPLAYQSSFGGSWVDTGTPIPDNCSGEFAPSGITVSGCVINSDIQDEINHAVAVHGWTASPTTMFFVFTPRNVGSCFDSISGDCAYTSYCAYHSYFGSGPVIYANVPYPDGSGIGSPDCGIGVYPNNDLADPAVNLVSHEHNEAITDPELNAWYDTSGLEGEIGDKCAWNFRSEEH